MISLFAIFAIIVFLGGTASGVFVLFVVSIHRTSRRPLTEIHRQRRGAVSRSILTATRTDRERDDE
ncbi:MAG: hypothetical protein JWM19_3369 [Actinomycetia bacterium]|nr:hypothetical protein [Actinomycetes bacterium]